MEPCGLRDGKDFFRMENEGKHVEPRGLRDDKDFFRMENEGKQAVSAWWAAKGRKFLTRRRLARGRLA